MKLFKRTIENFTCENCGFIIEGSGYTNHCPKCLFSKHVDVNPGDRAELCQGLMEPVSVEQNHGEYVIVHKCVVCGRTKKNKSEEQDDFEKIIALTH